jgi:aryl carrier-like protein
VATQIVESDDNLRDWLLDVVLAMAGSIQDDQSFEDAGLDSLSLISLARRLTSKLGRAVSVIDLYDHPTPNRLLMALSGGPVKQAVERIKAVALHGFRSNKEALQMSLAPFVSATGFVDWIFINSPRQATGPADPKIPDSDAYEWWGEEGGTFETGWMGPTYGGASETLRAVRDISPVGLLGFSQGGAVAMLSASESTRWMALFSSVVPPPTLSLPPQQMPSFHSYDPSEEFVHQCIDVAKHFSDKQVHEHNFGHNIPQVQELVLKFAEFASSHSK